MRLRRKPTPSFEGLIPASAASSRAKRMNRSVGTRHEHMLRSALWRLGLRFRKNVAALPGKPDIVFPSARLVIFCDGDFWHGREWRALAAKLRSGANASYWLQKIEANRRRDRKTSRVLSADGWTVLRIWESEIKKAPERIALNIEALVRDRREASHAIH
jgi:DNA mismatch endonuclease (patch repair protein)